MSPARVPPGRRSGPPREGVAERRVFLSFEAAAKAERLAGGRGAGQFSALINALMVAAEERGAPEPPASADS